MIKQIPILFSAPMVKAILERRKTQTRRVITERNSLHTLPFSELDFNTTYPNKFYSARGLKVKRKDDETLWRVTSKIEIEDILWVRENWFPAAINGNKVLIAHDVNKPQEAHEIETDRPEYYWKKMERARLIPSIHMPLEVCRIQLEVRDIKAERLHDISEEDVIAEGISGREFHDGILSYKSGYANLWQRINGEESWQSNPWVWVIEFKRRLTFIRAF